MVRVSKEEQRKRKKKTQQELIEEAKKGGTTSEKREIELFGGVGIEPELPKPTKIIYSEKGKPTGVEKPSGRTILGATPRDVAAITKTSTGTSTGVTGAGAIPGVTGGVIGAQEAAIQEQAQRRAEMIDIERQRLTTEEMPRRVELNPPELGATTVPLIGGIARQVALRSFDMASKLYPNRDLEEIKENLGYMTEDDIRNMAISEIQKEELRKALTTSEGVGSLIEALPGSQWLNKWFDIETPRGNLETVMTDIKSMRKQISKIGSDVRMGYIDPATAKMKLDTAEQYINFQEARLQLLIINSPSLEFNSDRVNKFETDILTVRETVAQAKIDVLMGVEKDPTMLDIYLKQKEQMSDEWASSDW